MRSGLGVAALVPLTWVGTWICTYVANTFASRAAPHAFAVLESGCKGLTPSGWPARSTRACLKDGARTAPKPKLTGDANLFPGLSAAVAAAVVARIVMKAPGKPVALPGIRVRKPKNNALRNASIATFEELSTRKPYMPLRHMYRRRLCQPKKSPIMMCGKTRRQTGARSQRKKARMYRTIDFNRTKRGIWGEVETIEYDPYRNARICLVRYEDGERRYILHALGMFVGQQVIAAEDAQAFVGNAMPIGNVPLGTLVHNIEFNRDKGCKVCHAAGTAALILARDEIYVTVKLPSSEVRLFKRNAFCTIGRVSRVEANMIKRGKAGKSRQLGRRPHVRGSAKNACDHPHGGGEGRSPIGHKHPKTPTGKAALGKRTRSKSFYQHRVLVFANMKKVKR